MTEYRWRKSSRSTGGSNCVEVALTGWRKSSRSTGSDDCVEVALTGWRKSSRSTGDSDCVEVALVGSGAVRDSKNPAGPTLALDLSGLLAAVKDGRLDR